MGRSWRGECPIPSSPQKKFVFLVYSSLIEREGEYMINIAIDKNIELPKERVRHEYPYRDMDVGDSFYVDDGKINVMCNNNYRMGKVLGCKFIARVEDGGVRVWRIA